MASLSLVIINGVRAKGRDAKRVSDVRQIAAALDLYFANEGSYPTVLTPGQSLVGATTGNTYMVKIPNNATPSNDGSCASGSEYSYTQINSGQSYLLSYCLGGQVSNASANTNCATPGNTAATPGTLGFSGNAGSSPEPECSPCICGDCSSLNCDGLSDFATSTASCVVGSMTYYAIKEGAQCWLDKNINIGTRINIPASGNVSNMRDDTALNKWCYSDSEAICSTDGGIYSWAQAMYLPYACNSGYSGNCAMSAYLIGSGASAKRQGICPKGWHVPSDYEFTVLENFLDSSVTLGINPDYYADQTGTAGTTGWRGTDVGTKLKANGASHLNFPLAGFWDSSNGQRWRGSYGSYWASPPPTNNYAWNRSISPGEARVSRTYSDYFGATRPSGNSAMSVRCLKD